MGVTNQRINHLIKRIRRKSGKAIDEKAAGLLVKGLGRVKI